jgi:hypothetical protein
MRWLSARDAPKTVLALLATVLPVLLIVACGPDGGLANDVGNGKPTGSSNAVSMYTRSSTAERLAYARVIRLQHSGSGNGTLMGTFEHSRMDGTPAKFDIRESVDDGATWTTKATIGDPLTGPDHPSTRLWQPFLFELPQQMGAFPAGTLILLGNIAANTRSTDFVLWRSTDHGATWKYQSIIQAGGGAGGAPHGGSGVWEPFLVVNGKGQLAMYFSDERLEPTYAQVLAHIVSNDGGVTWSAKPDGSTNFAPGRVIDVGSAVNTDRPGMPTLATLPGGRMVMAYEFCGAGRQCAAHIKTSTDGGTTWGAGPQDVGTKVVTSDGRYLKNSPYVVWTPAGGPSGELMLAGRWTLLTGSNAKPPHAIFLNTAEGTGPWSWMPAPFQPTTGTAVNCKTNYSPDLLLSPQGTSVRYTAATAVDKTGCMERSATSGIGPHK